MDKVFKIAFKGEIADGFSSDDVRNRFAERFQKDEDVIDRLFSGASFTLAKDLDFDRANAAAGSLREIGAIVYLVDEFGDYFEVAVPPTANESGINPRPQSADEAPATEKQSATADEPADQQIAHPETQHEGQEDENKDGPKQEASFCHGDVPSPVTTGW